MKKAKQDTDGWIRVELFLVEVIRQCLSKKVNFGLPWWHSG